MDMYDTQGDSYRELAKRRWLKANGYPVGYDSPGRSKIDNAWVARERGKFKKLILSGIYGQSIKTLSAEAGLSLEDGMDIWNSFIGQMVEVARFRDENIEYGSKTGFAKTILGEKIPLNMKRIWTTANNTVVQNFTAVILATFFYNCIERAINLGINVSSKFVIHDSQTIEFPINKLFHMDLICRKYFRQACRKYFKPDYKFDWDLLLDLMDHMPYSFNIETGEVSVRLWTEKVDYFLDHLSTSYSFNVVSRTNKDNCKGERGRDKFLKQNPGKYHALSISEKFRQNKQTELKLQLTEPLKDIDWWYEPLKPTFDEHVSEFKSLEIPRIEGYTYGCKF